MDLKDLIKNAFSQEKTLYWYFIAENDGHCCETCSHLDGKVFCDDDPLKPELPLHPNCRCIMRKATVEESGLAMKNVQPKETSFKGKTIESVVSKVKEIYKVNIPKPPRTTNHNANWLHMTWMWFFEQGKNPARFSYISPESKDIANSYSIKTLKEEYFRTGKIPQQWNFSGPKTATGKLGEVEWFLGSYSIKDFKLEKGIATFTVYNKSGWHSGTRLPKSWTDAIKEKTSYEIKDLVTDAPRGKVIKTKIEKYFPEVSKFPEVGYILNSLPSFGGDWEQYYEIRMEWKK